MLYQYVKRYLKNSVGTARIDFEWSSLDNIKFFAFMEKRYDLNEISKEISEVKVAFKDFFEPVGNIVFRYKEESGIKFKIFPYRVEPQNSQHLNNIVKIINNNRKQIKYLSQGDDDQIVILGKIRREVNKELFDTPESINTKELIKYALRVALDLNDKDIITQLKRKYIIKIFKQGNVLDVEEEVLVTSKKDSNFNGYTAEQIEETYKDIFKKGNANITYFLNSVMKHILRNDLSFKTIDNKYYEAKSLRIIHKQISKELMDYIQLEDDYILGISGYIIRKHFSEIHKIMAIDLIKYVYEKDANANKFLLYYSGKTMLIDNKKYIIPSLVTKEGQQWNISSLIGICNSWMNIKIRKESYEHKLSDTQKKIQEINKRILHIKPEREAREKTIKETQKEIETFSKTHNALVAKFKQVESSSLNSTEYFELEKELAISNEHMQELEGVVNEAKMSIKSMKDANLTVYTELEFLTEQKKQLLNDVKAQTQNINSKNSQMDPIIESIVKVLMARTTLA